MTSHNKPPLFGPPALPPWTAVFALIPTEPRPVSMTRLKYYAGPMRVVATNASEVLRDLTRSK